MMHLHIRTVDVANWWNHGPDFGPGYLSLAIGFTPFHHSLALRELLCNFTLEEEPLYFYESRYGEVVLAWFRSAYASSYDGQETFLQNLEGVYESVASYHYPWMSLEGAFDTIYIVTNSTHIYAWQKLDRQLLSFSQEPL